jgi:hypothetical protein
VPYDKGEKVKWIKPLLWNCGGNHGRMNDGVQVIDAGRSDIFGNTKLWKYGIDQV